MTGTIRGRNIYNHCVKCNAVILVKKRNGNMFNERLAQTNVAECNECNKESQWMKAKYQEIVW